MEFDLNGTLRNSATFARRYQEALQADGALGELRGEEAKASQAERNGSPDRQFKLTRLSDVSSKPLEWLWLNYIPLGKVSMIDGDPGLGKSLLTLDIAARASTQRTMPDGSASALTEAAGIVLLSLEDDPGDTIRPRLEAASADLERIVLLESVKEKDEERVPTLADIDVIKYSIKAVNAKLVIIDPLMAHLPNSPTIF